MKNIFYILIIAIIGKSYLSLSCSLIFDTIECNKINKCMWTVIETKEIYSNINTVRKCLDKNFILENIKSQIFEEDFFKRNNSDLVKESDLKENLDLGNPKDIEKLIQSFIKNGKVPFFNSFVFLENEY